MIGFTIIQITYWSWHQLANASYQRGPDGYLPRRVKGTYTARALVGLRQQANIEIVVASREALDCLGLVLHHLIALSMSGVYHLAARP
jgi:hypothetical protein